jgi:hypothetical protein
MKCIDILPPRIQISHILYSVWYLFQKAIEVIKDQDLTDVICQCHLYPKLKPKQNNIVRQ